MPDIARVRWEHWIARKSDIREEFLDEAGENGWELVSVERGDVTPDGFCHLYFKRRLIDA